jgi:hypothetical protein
VCDHVKWGRVWNEISGCIFTEVLWPFFSFFFPSSFLIGLGMGVRRQICDLHTDILSILSCFIWARGFGNLKSFFFS